MQEKAAQILRSLNDKTEWLAARWGTEWDAVTSAEADAADTEIRYYDLHGRLVATLLPPFSTPDTALLPPGVYVCRTVCRGFTRSSRRIVVPSVH